MAQGIYNTVITQLASVVNTAVTGLASTYKRLRPKLIDSDSIPCVIVCPASDGERILFEGFGGTVAYAYPVTCLLVSKGNTITTNVVGGATTAADTDFDDHMNLREVLRNGIYKRTLSGAPSVFNGEIEMAPAVAIAGSEGALYLVSAARMTLWSLESQTW